MLEWTLGVTNGWVESPQSWGATLASEARQWRWLQGDRRVVLIVEIRSGAERAAGIPALCTCR
jgi:hypothetical protein